MQVIISLVRYQELVDLMVCGLLLHLPVNVSITMHTWLDSDVTSLTTYKINVTALAKREHAETNNNCISTFNLVRKVVFIYNNRCMTANCLGVTIATKK